MVDPVALAKAGVDGEAEGAVEPVDHRGGIAVAEGREDAWGFDGHGVPHWLRDPVNARA